MRALLIPSTGSSTVLRVSSDSPTPVPSPTQVLVKIEYAGVNFIDIYQRNGLYKVPLPSVAGREGAGVITALGSAVRSDVCIGDKVAVFTQGTYAEYVCAEADRVLKLPEDVTAEVGAAIMLQGLTAWTLVKDAHQVQQGEWVLVQAAAGGTGGLVAQMAKHLGARVIGTASKPDKCIVAKNNGCDFVINYKAMDVTNEVMRLTDGLGCHAVFSGVGQSTFDADLKCTRRKGTLVTYGNSSGPVGAIKPLLLSVGNVKLVRPTLANYIQIDEEFKARSDELVGLLSNGVVKVRIERVFSLEETGLAQDMLSGGKTVGKLLVKV